MSISLSQTFSDTSVMTRRSLRHVFRSSDTIITVVAMPIALMLLFVYVIGGSIDTGSISYINFMVPGIVLMTIISGIAYTAVRLNMDKGKGIINRFRCMPVASSSILGGHVVASVLSNLFSVLLVILVAFAVGFRSDANLVSWLLFVGIILLFNLAATWLAAVFGLLSKSAEGAGAFSYVFLLLVFLSPTFSTLDSMNSVVRVFATYQPLTPIIETLRSLMMHNAVGSNFWVAIAWCVALLAFSYFAALRIYKRSTA